MSMSQFFPSGYRYDFVYPLGTLLTAILSQASLLASWAFRLQKSFTKKKVQPSSNLDVDIFFLLLG
jgi:hypothetical protein